MKYRPSPKYLIAKYEKPPEKKGFLILPETEQDTRVARVVVNSK